MDPCFSWPATLDLFSPQHIFKPFSVSFSLFNQEQGAKILAFYVVVVSYQACSQTDQNPPSLIIFSRYWYFSVRGIRIPLLCDHRTGIDMELACVLPPAPSDCEDCSLACPGAINHGIHVAKSVVLLLAWGQDKFCPWSLKHHIPVEVGARSYWKLERT